MIVVTKLEKLREVALDQHGFVTTMQALEEGVSNAELSTMVARGRLGRVAHGVYRVPQVAATEFDQYQLAVLWAGVPEACLSHHTALASWGIGGVKPVQIHLTVDRRRRLRRTGGEGYVVHRLDLDPGQVTRWWGIPIADVPTTIAQCIDDGLPTHLAVQAMDKAWKLGQLVPEAKGSLEELLVARDLATPGRHVS